MIDVIIPTMWYVNDFQTTLQKYLKHPLINKVIVIDNNKQKRPLDIVDTDKLQLVSYGKNIYVNPAWNEGYFRSSSKIIAIINDDVRVDSSIFDLVEKFDPKPGDLIGVNLRGRQSNYKIDDNIDTEEKIVKLNYDRSQPIGGQAWAFGICMFMHRETYSEIPSLYQVWYGDDYLAQRAKSVYAINSNKIKGTISETLTKFTDPNSDVSKRIELDSKNLLQYNHFTNAKNWDIPKNMIQKYASERSQLQKDVLQGEYKKAQTIKSDINENVHILHDLAKECESVVEMGVRTGVSTRAFLATDVKLTSYDIVMSDEVSRLFSIAKAKNKDVAYIKADVLNIQIEEADLLFIGTLHTYPQLKRELELHGNKAKKYLVFHDTHTFGTRGELQSDSIGLLPALIEFMIKNDHWRFFIHKTNNNGLTVLKRTS